MASDVAASVISRHDYRPFGEELVAGVGGRTTGMGFPGNADGIRQKFTLKERDNETGLDYFGARYYANTQGRFTGVDPIAITKERLADPQRLNLYAYGRNDPLIFTDPTGEDIIVEGGTQDQQQAVRLSITTIRAQSATANAAFTEYDSKKGPDLTITIMADALFAQMPGVQGNQTQAITSEQGGDAANSKVKVGASVVVRASAIDLRTETNDRNNRRETKVEAILSHEVPGHAKDITTDPRGYAQRFQQDQNLPYETRRNEISADRASKRVAVERLIGHYVKFADFRRDLRFGRKMTS